MKEPPGKLLHRLMSSESVLVVAMVVDGEDKSSSGSTPKVATSELLTEDPSDEPTGVPLDHADAAIAQTKAAQADDDPVDEEKWNKQAAQGYFPGGFDASEQSPQQQSFTLLRQAML